MSPTREATALPCHQLLRLVSRIQLQLRNIFSSDFNFFSANCFALLLDTEFTLLTVQLVPRVSWDCTRRAISDHHTHLLGHRIGPRVRQLQRRRTARISLAFTLLFHELSEFYWRSKRRLCTDLNCQLEFNSVNCQDSESRSYLFHSQQLIAACAS